MTSLSKKGGASVVLALIGFVLLIDDFSGRLQKVEMFAPPSLRPYLPLLYGMLFLGAMLLIRSEHQDALAALQQPDMAAILEAQLRLRNENDKLKNEVTRLSPRVLSESQKRCLRQHLKPITDAMQSRGTNLQILISAEGEGWDSADYAREYEDFLGSLGFKISRYGLSGKHIGDDYRRGLWFRWSTEREKGYALPFGQKFVDALRACEIDISASDDPDWGFYELIIGAKPPL